MRTNDVLINGFEDIKIQLHVFKREIEEKTEVENGDR